MKSWQRALRAAGTSSIMLVRACWRILFGMVPQTGIRSKHHAVAQQAVAGVFRTSRPPNSTLPSCTSQNRAIRLHRSSCRCRKADDRGGRPESELIPSRRVRRENTITHADVEGLGTKSSPTSSKRGILGASIQLRVTRDSASAAHHFDVRVQHEARNHEQQAFDRIHIAAQVQQPRREERRRTPPP